MDSWFGDETPEQTFQRLQEETDRHNSLSKLSFDSIPTWAKVLGLAGSLGGAYHGYKRNNSIGWALVWSFLGGLFAPVVLTIAVAQGFGQPKKT